MTFKNPRHLARRTEFCRKQDRSSSKPIKHPRCCRPASSWVHYTTSCNTQSSAPEDGQNNCPKHVELAGIINKPLLLHLVGCLYYLYQWCTVKQISDKEIYLLIKYIKSVLWRAAKRLSYIEDARCLKVKVDLPCNGRPNYCRLIKLVLKLIV